MTTTRPGSFPPYDEEPVDADESGEESYGRREYRVTIPPAPVVGEDRGVQAEGPGPQAPLSGASAFVLAAASLWQREVIRFLRQPARIIGALGVPIVFWLVIGSGLGRSFQPEAAAANSPVGAAVVSSVGGAAGQVPAFVPRDSHYLTYFFAGSLALILLFTAIFSTISVIEDRRDGFLQGVLVSPAPRGALVLGKVLGGTTIAVLQGMIFLVAAPFIGIGVTPVVAVATFAAMVLVAFGMTALGFLIAWGSSSTQGYHAIMNLLLMPMWLLSGAVFPASGADGWIRALMAINPLTYGVALLRRVLFLDGVAPGSAGLPPWTVSLTVTAGFAVAMYFAAWFATARARKVTT